MYKEAEKDESLVEKLEKMLRWMKPLSITLVAFVPLVGIMACFIVGMVKEFPGLEQWNMFTSIVLGIIATIVSIISFILSFYSIEKTDESERRQQNLVNQIITTENDIKNLLDGVKKDTQDLVSQNRAIKHNTTVVEEEKKATFEEGLLEENFREEMSN